MAGITDSLMSLLGMNNDPTQAILAGSPGGGAPQQLAGAAPAAPPVPAGAGGVGATATAPAPAAAPASVPPPGGMPPDMTELYQKLLDKDRGMRNLDSGMTLLAASIARPSSRAALISGALGGDQNGSGVATQLKTMMEMQTAQRGAMTQAALRAQLPAISQKYGLDPATVQNLFETGKLPDLLLKLSNPDTEIVKTDEGATKLINKRTSQQIGANIGEPAEGKNIQIIGGSNGIPLQAFNKDTNESKIIGRPVENTTADQKNLEQINIERAAAGQAPLPMQDFLKDQNSQRAKVTQTITDKMGGKLGEEFAKIAAKDYEAANTSSDVMDRVQEARANIEKGIIAGSMYSPTELEGRKLLSSLFGLDPSKAANTEQFKSAMKEIVLPKVKALGTGNSISNADVDFIEGAVGGDIKMTPLAMKRILTSLELGAYNKAQQWNEKAAKMRAENPDISSILPDVKTPELSNYITDSIPKSHIDAMLQHADDPKVRADFDQIYGHGLARILTVRRNRAAQ